MAPLKEFDYFDVRRRQRFENNVRKEIPRELSINLMCFLLRGISYQALYEDPIIRVSGKHLFDKLIENAKKLPDELQVDAEGNEYDMTSVFTKSDKTGGFDEVKTLIDDYNRIHNKKEDANIVLGDFFWKDNTAEPDADLKLVRKNIGRELNKITLNKHPLRHFCAPFVPIVLGNASLIRKDVFDRFMEYFRDKNLMYFYISSGTPDEQLVAKEAREAGILSEEKLYKITRKPGTVEAMVRGEGNRKHCVNGTCCNSNNDDTWCEQVIVNGNSRCALGSDYGTQCYPVAATAKPKVPKGGPKRPTKS